jgi:cell division protein FtsB
MMDNDQVKATIHAQIQEFQTLHTLMENMKQHIANLEQEKAAKNA